MRRAPALGFAIVAVTAALTAWTGPAGADTVTCDGHTATIVGTAGDDTLNGTDGPDVIVAGDGEDVVNAGGGDDIVCGGKGRDRLYGDDGNDHLFGQFAHDHLDGGAGDDLLEGGSAGDILIGGTGDDVLHGGKQSALNDPRRSQFDVDWADYSQATGPLDVDLKAGTATSPSTGNDHVAGIENVAGGIGDDHIYGDDRGNELWGDDGADVLVGRGGSDSLVAQGKVFAGEGAVQQDGARDVMRGGHGNDFMAVYNGDVGYGGDGDDEFLVGGRRPVVHGGNGSDDIGDVAGAMHAELNGDSGSDRLEIVRSGQCPYWRSPCRVHVDLAAGGYTVDKQGATVGSGSLFGIENVRSKLAATLRGDGGHNVLTGGSGRDLISGRGGDDTISGKGGADVLTGDGGRDKVNGGPGDDKCSGEVTVDCEHAA